MLETTFLNWDQPLLTKLVDHLLTLKEEVVNKIVIVPTVQSGRQLRRALAEAGIGLSPRVVTPEILLPKRNPGTRAAGLYAWTDVLLNLDLDDARGLFPKDPPAGVVHSFRWAFNVAKQLIDLQQTLHDNGKTFKEISRRSIESERWENLALLDENVTKTLRKWNIKSPETDDLEPIPPDKQLIIASVCDISPLAISRLENLLESGISIHILVHAPESYLTYFDQWGRPLSDYWCQCKLPLPGWEKSVTIAENPSLAARQIVTEIAADNLTPQQVSLGLCDRDMVLSLQQEFATAGWKVYDPEGTSARSSSLVLFLTALGEWLATHAQNPISSFAKLVRLPEMEAFIPNEVDRFHLTKQLDACLEKRLPLSSTELDHYLQNTKSEDYPLLKSSLHYFLTESEAMLSGNKIRGLRGWIATLLNRTNPEIAALLVDDLSDILDALETIEQHSGKGGLEITQAIEILTEITSSKKSYQDTTGSCLDLLGWMELIYEDAPTLFLVGMHEGHVPALHGDDPFLPDSFREMLGMESGDIHYARDSFLLQSFIESRANVRMIVSKLSDSNEPKTPSRLLLRTTGKDLADRVQTFFGEAHLQSENPSPWKRDWQLTIPKIQNHYAPDSESVRPLSPSALKDYLYCPLRFFLKKVVNMKRYEANKTEMGALDFGLLVHAVVEKFGKDESVKDSISAAEITKVFDDLLENELFYRYGGNPNLAIKIQAEIAQSRLHRLANLQAEQAIAGWRIIDVELDIGKEIQWAIAGHPIKMQIDRVERNLHSGEIRVMDYKTSSDASGPIKAHIENVNEKENRPICGQLLPPAPKGRTERRWKNLQLPIYAWFAQQHYGCSDIPSIGYIQLPKTLSDTSFSIWEDFNPDLLESAKEWTTNAIKEIQQGDFFHPATPPNKEENWDDFSKLAQGNIAEAFGILKSQS